MSDSKEMARFEALAEEAYTRLYDVRDRNVKECVEDALYNLQRALDIAQMRGLALDAARLAKRRDHISAVYASQFRQRT
jgi:hypothetical protein